MPTLVRPTPACPTAPARAHAPGLFHTHMKKGRRKKKMGKKKSSRILAAQLPATQRDSITVQMPVSSPLTPCRAQAGGDRRR